MPRGQNAKKGIVDEDSDPFYAMARDHNIILVPMADCYRGAEWIGDKLQRLRI